MEALHLVDSWPVDHAAAAIVRADAVDTIGPTDMVVRVASLGKAVTGWAVMVAVEEGVIDLDAPLRHASAAEGATMRHLLSHAAGFGFDGEEPISRVEATRIYSNTGIERAADELAGAAAMPFERYLVEGVLTPLGMTSTELRGSPAFELHSNVDDMSRFVHEMRCPRLISTPTRDEFIRPQFPELAGIVPGVGRFDPCPWGLGVEIRGDKTPHWTGRSNSPSTFGHFGGSGTMMWVDPVADVGVVALTDRTFDEWAPDALRCWPEFSDAVLAEAGVTG